MSAFDGATDSNTHEQSTKQSSAMGSCLQISMKFAGSDFSHSLGTLRPDSCHLSNYTNNTGELFFSAKNSPSVVTRRISVMESLCDLCFSIDTVKGQ